MKLLDQLIHELELGNDNYLTTKGLTTILRRMEVREKELQVLKSRLSDEDNNIISNIIPDSDIREEQKAVVKEKQHYNPFNPLTKEQKIKSALVHFFREGTFGDYEQSLNNAIKEIVDIIEEES